LAGDPKMMPLLEEKKIIVTTAGSDVIPYSTAVTHHSGSNHSGSGERGAGKVRL